MLYNVKMSATTLVFGRVRDYLRLGPSVVTKVSTFVAWICSLVDCRFNAIQQV
jgi:hypothetical protein